jgi:4-amino-4-deoxy-L-arabinose transferase-like glycosyltransferase
MADPDPLFALEVRLAEFRLYYWRVDHPSPLWRWRGQVLVACATAATALPLLALAAGIADALLRGQSVRGGAGALALGAGSLALLFAAGFQVSAYWARQGQVQRGGWLLVGLLTSALVALRWRRATPPGRS